MAREGIHPKYFEAKIICTTCGTDFMSGSTKGEELKVDTCSSCHPFYTGNQQFSNSAGRVERFKSKFTKKEELTKQVAEDSKSQKEINIKTSKQK
ncbi:50S ribosomal protein L31 [Spiroplasma chrysopicola]|uniref:50S ribosomal protein L31 n=1 Tax=Spiroplasma chrysopicola DF-1 TaxID=1276227 RepID=R4U063_9MOLU|nr:50S ribosomal protein L31 [Spiroplasma chrysopicola DF-1]